MKKRTYFLLSATLLVVALGLVYIQKEVDRMDQIKLQYDNEVISPLKRELETSPFDAAIAAQSLADKDRVRGLVLGKEIQAVQELVKEGKISVEEVLLFYVERIKLYDGYYNSVIQLNPLALEEARKLDDRIAEGQVIGELAGTIVLIKDNVSALNMNTSAGAYVLKDLTTSRDAFLVETIKKKDGIILGKNNLSEWSNFMSMPSSNGFSVLGGQTKNAYGKYDVGGSSSGPAVASAMNFASITVGSETSGSLIYPASQNSIVAIKPTIGALSRDLVIPISEAQDSLGFMGRQVADVYTLFKASVAIDLKDEAHDTARQLLEKRWPNSLDAGYLKNLHVGVIEDDSIECQELIEELEALEAVVVPLSLEEDKGLDILSVLNDGMVNDLEDFLTNEAVQSPVGSLEEIRRFNEQNKALYAPYGDFYHEHALKQKTSSKEIEAIIENNRMLSQKTIDDALSRHNIEVIISFSNDLSAIYSSAAYPALTVPAGYKETGEPYGITFIGSELDDIKLFQIAYAYEQGTQHRKLTRVKPNTN